MLPGKNILVTGGAGGVGYAVAQTVYALGGRVLLFDAMLTEGGELRAGGEEVLVDQTRLISGDTRRVDCVYGNVNDDEAIERALALLEKRFGAIDGLVACHGLAWEQSLLAQDAEMLSRIFQQDVLATYRLTQKVAARMVEGKQGGSIVLSVHPGALRGMRGQSAVSAASAALWSMTRSAALELRKHKVRINAVAPTARTRVTEAGTMFQSLAANSMRPESAAKLYAFLLSDETRELSGEALGVAGNRIYSLQVSETVGHFFAQEEAPWKEYSAAVVAALNDGL